MKPKIPIQAHTRWTMGLSSAAPSLAPSLARKAIREKRTKKMDENPRATAMKAGVVAVGADNQRDASLGSTERSERGITSGSSSMYCNGHRQTVCRIQNGDCAIDGCVIVGP